MNGILNMNGHNIMYPSRIQGPDGKPIVVASGDGNNNNTYVDLLGSRVQCRNTNGTAWIPVQGYSFTNPSSRLIKENIRDMTEDEARKILDVRWSKRAGRCDRRGALGAFSARSDGTGWI